jgi:MoaA/NifB/PqqE/SkfB family radical SAM enzyme
MVTGQKNTLSVEQWCQGIDQLKKLNCGFLAFYGAEPLLEMKKLPYVIQHAERRGIPCTVITSGCVPDFEKKLYTLIWSGLKSLTMSYDIVPHDKATREKSAMSIDYLETFQKMCPDYRDTAAVVTLHKKNFREIIPAIEMLSEKNIWTFFDLYHYDRGQCGSKVGPLDPELAFQYEEISELIDILKGVMRMKEKGYLVHANKVFVDVLEQPRYRNYRWLCADGDNTETFPSWLTIDCDGAVYPCDDFHTKDFPLKDKVNVLNISDHFNLFRNWWADEVYTHCPGCLWSTHIQAHAIKEERMEIKDYVHKR